MLRETIGLPPVPVESGVNEETTENQELLKEREGFSTDLQLEIDNATDRLVKLIEPNIKNPVVMLNAFDLKTSQYCKGHLDKWSRGAPWVEITPKLTPYT